jgi:glycosyltransferase involved in cell wall biosynthesis
MTSPSPTAVHCLGWYFPQATGGTEVYVDGLIAELRARGYEGIVAAPGELGEERGSWNGTPVYRYPVPPQTTVGQRVGLEPHADFQAFETWLARQQTGIYHQHSWTFGCGMHHLAAAKRLGYRTVLTVHVPALVCPRGSMMHAGKAECARPLSERSCADCWLQAHGMPAPVRAVVSRIPVAVGQKLRPFQRWGTAAAATSLVHSHREHLMNAVANADRVVAVCDWLYEALARNGVPRDKLVLHRQGVSDRPAVARERSRTAMPLVVGFLGRLDRLKGFDVLVEAMHALPAQANVELHATVVESREPQLRNYQDRLFARAAAHPRIRMNSAIRPEEVPRFLSGIDVLAVPSQCMETGPLVALEALAAGVPVLGSDLGGLRELVVDGTNGLLVAPHDDPSTWAKRLLELAGAPDSLASLRQGIAPVRTMSDAAADTARLYAELLQA